MKSYTLKLSPEHDLILKLISPDGTKRAGMEVALMWARHFYQLGLREDDPLDCVGLSVKTPEEYLTWDAYHNAQDGQEDT